VCCQIEVRPLACWGCEFDSHQVYSCLSVVCVVRYRFGRWLVGVASSILTGDIVVCLLCVLSDRGSAVGVASSILTGDTVVSLLCVLSDRGLCDVLIARREESYHAWCV
jgi:hypothetical protein